MSLHENAVANGMIFLKFQSMVPTKRQYTALITVTLMTSFFG